MNDEQETKTGSKSMYDTIMNVPGAKRIGAPPDKKKAADQILASYAGRQTDRNEEIMKNFADSVNQPARSIGERLEEDENQ